MKLKMLMQTVMLCTVLSFPAVAKDGVAQGQLEQKLLNLFDLNEEVAAYAKHCLKSPDPQLMARYQANTAIVAQALLNHAADARPHQTPTAVRSQLRERQSFKRHEGEQLFMNRGCNHAGAKTYQQHFATLSAMTDSEMQAAVYGRPLTETP